MSSTDSEPAESQPPKSVHALLERLDGSGSDAEWEAKAGLKELGDALPQALLWRFRRATRFGARAACVYHAIPHASRVEAAYELGLLGIEDRSAAVVYRACMLLSVAQRTEALPALEECLERADGQKAEDLAAAIDAIESANQHFFVDREHSGKVKLRVS